MVRLLILKFGLLTSEFERYEITVEEKPPVEASSITNKLLLLLANSITKSLSIGLANLASAIETV